MSTYPDLQPLNSGDSVPATYMNTLLAGVQGLYNVPNQAGVLEFPEMSIVHSNGVADAYVGIGTPISSGNGAGSDGSGGLLLTPVSQYWGSLNFPAIAMNLQCYTNALETDLATGNPFLQVYMAYGRLTGVNSGATGQLLAGVFNKGFISPSQGTYHAPRGTTNSPALVNDYNTLFSSVDNPVDSSIGAYNIGIGGTYSRSYFTFGMSIPANAASKTYKFKFFLRYQ